MNLENLAASLDDGWDLAIEVAVKQIDQFSRRHVVGQRREPTHVRQPDRRVDFFDVTAPDASVENALSGLVPDTGVDQIAITIAAGLGRSTSSSWFWRARRAGYEHP